MALMEILPSEKCLFCEQKSDVQMTAKYPGLDVIYYACREHSSLGGGCPNKKNNREHGNGRRRKQASGGGDKQDSFGEELRPSDLFREMAILEDIIARGKENRQRAEILLQKIYNNSLVFPRATIFNYFNKQGEFK